VKLRSTNSVASSILSTSRLGTLARTRSHCPCMQLPIFSSPAVHWRLCSKRSNEVTPSINITLKIYLYLV
jgi:hypothetical protein